MSGEWSGSDFYILLKVTLITFSLAFFLAHCIQNTRIGHFDNAIKCNVHIYKCHSWPSCSVLMS